MADDQVTFTMDGQELTVPKGTLLIRAAEMLQITIPRFCDHPLLEPVAACRQCLVEIEGQRKPMTSCSTPAADGMVVRTHLTSDIAREGQEAQLEFLLINHPLDCPMCDKGGECPLQDQTLAHGPGASRFVERKRRYLKPVPISPLVGLDRERCVLCARCTRFSKEISGDPFIELFERGALEQVAIYEDEPYHSYFSGNVVQICPVGALTSKDYRFGARPFDLRAVDGICNQCSGGCNLRIDMRNGRIERQLARTNMAVNEMWLSDKCRHGYHFVGHPTRIVEPSARNDLGAVEPTSLGAAVRAAAGRLRAALDAGGPEAVGVLTGGNLTDEDAYAASRFARDVLGTDNVDFRRSVRTTEELPVLGAVAGTFGPTFDDVEHAGVVVLAGLDPEEEAPGLYLRLRKAVRRHGQRIVAVGPSLGSVTDVAWRWIRTAPGGEARILRLLSGKGDPPREGSDLASVGAALDEAVEAAAGGPGVVVLAGERLAQSPSGLAAAAELATAGDGRAFAWVPRKAGARGAVEAGLLPGLLPGGRALDEPGPVADVWSRVPAQAGLDTRGMLQAAADGRLRALYLIGVDPIRDFEDAALARAALERVDSVIVQDLLTTDTTRYADVVLPAAAPQERVGSFTNWEGRRQAFPQVVPPAGLCLEDWDLLRLVSRALGRDLGWERATDVRREAAPLMAAGHAAHDRLAQLRSEEPPAPDRDGDGDGQLTVEAVPPLLGRGSMLRGADALLATARPVEAWVHPDDARAAGVADGDPVVVAGPEGRIELPVRVTDRVAAGCVRLPQNATDDPLGVLADPQAGAGAPVRVRLQARETATAGS
ncbi:MAG TPA: NADH-quinone oxidoreductase subunit G [Euzebyales bacterium]|nr:NADH-quinone oxidoreductase subunit G [Euzebyales bacterium]